MSFRDRNSHRELKTAIQNLALGGFITSLCIHLAALKGEVLFPAAMLMHFGIFIVFFPTVVATETPSKLGIPMQVSWKKILKGCPPWMIAVAIVIAVYAFVNFVMFVETPLQHSGSDLSTTAEELRGFSGHWMVFYWVSYALMYSHLNYIEPRKLQ